MDSKLRDMCVIASDQFEAPSLGLSLRFCCSNRTTVTHVLFGSFGLPFIVPLKFDGFDTLLLGCSLRSWGHCQLEELQYSKLRNHSMR